MSQSDLVLEQALQRYKRFCAEEPRLRRLDLRRLAGIEPGPHQTELDLLDFVVAPSVHGESKQQATRTATILFELNDPALPRARRRELEEELSRLENARWNHLGGRGRHATEPSSFAEALHEHRRLIVIGDPGAGKTVLTRLAFLACTEGEAGTRARGLLCDDDGFNHAARGTVGALRELLPVRLALGGLGDALLAPGELSVLELIREQLRARRASELLEGLGAVLEAGKLFLLCDGLDEVAERQRGRVVDALAEFFESYQEVRLLVTSRPNGYRPRVPRLAHAWLAPLHPRQQRALVTRLHRLIELREGDAESAARARRRTRGLLSEIQPGRTWQWMGGNPLLLTLSSLTPTGEDGSPRHEVFVFENFIRTLLGEWRSVLALPEAEVDGLMEVWSTVAHELVRQEQRGGGVQALFLRLLDEVTRKTATSPPIDTRRALRLALETGLLREEDKVLVFWHSTFAEFLAARALVRNGERGATERILAEERLPRLVLKFAAALLDQVCGARGEVAALVHALLKRDARGAGAVLRPGLRAVSACLGDGLRLDPALTERVWSTWAELLERTPPSVLWEDFGTLARSGPTPLLPAALLERFARLADRGVRDLREALARLIAPAAARVPAAQDVCARWMNSTLDTETRLHGALGLASAGTWNAQVIDVLGHFGRIGTVDPELVAERVRWGGAPLWKDLKGRILRKPDSGQGSDSVSEACLLAVAGQWDPDVAEVLRLALAGGSNMNRHEDAAVVLRLRSDLQPVRAALLDWISERSSLGDRARAIVQDVAPLHEGMPEEVLKRTASAPPKVFQELERLLIGFGEERRSLVDTLRRWLDDPHPEQRLCAARLLRRFSPGDSQLHAALRRGMRSEDDAARARWAWLAVESEPGLIPDAVATLISCARSGESSVRARVYERMYWLMSKLDWEPLAGWIECARTGALSAEARLAAAELVSSAPKADKRHIVPVLYELLEDRKPTIRRRAAQELLVRHEVRDSRVVAVMAEEAARAIATPEDDFRGWELGLAEDFATTAVQAIFRGLPDVEPPPIPEEERHRRITLSWSSILERLVLADPSSVGHLLDALARRGPAREAATGALLLLMQKHSFARKALRERIAHHKEAGTSPREIFTLLDLGLMHEKTVSAASEALRALKRQDLTQAQQTALAGRLCKGAEDVAVDLWRRALEGADVELVLEATEALAVYFQGEVGEWLQPAIERVLKTTEPTLRVDAARVALWCGLAEEEAVKVLLECLDLSGHAHARRQDDWLLSTYESQIIFRGREFLDSLHELRFSRHERKVDFEAMHALCVYRPVMGIPRLASWLEEEGEERFDCAVRVLAKWDGYGEAVQTALMKRFHEADGKRLGHLIYLRSMSGLQLPDVAEQVVARLTPRPELIDDDTLCLREWLGRYPGLWAVIRRQGRERRPAFAYLLSCADPITPDAVLFAVETSLEHPADGPGRQASRVLESWCAPRPDQAAPLERDESSNPTPETVCGWLREALLERNPPEDLRSLIQFDTLARIAGLPTRQRTNALRRALSLDVVTIACDSAERMDLFYLQAEAAYLIQELGGRDERLLPIFEAAVYAFSWEPLSKRLQRIKSLLCLRPPDVNVQKALLHAIVAGKTGIDLDDELEVLELAGFSVEQRIDILLNGLQPRSDLEWADEQRHNEAPHVLKAAVALGCAPERIATLVTDLVSDPRVVLSARVLRKLSERPELAEVTATKILLRALALDDQKAHAQWLKRFTASPQKSGHAERWRGVRETTYLPIRLRSLASLTQVRNAPLVERSLAQLADEPAANRLLWLYQQAVAGSALSDADWDELSSRLSLGPDEDSGAQLAKEWLTLGLWRALEPEAVDRLFQS
jgi:hypothetical protein